MKLFQITYFILEICLNTKANLWRYRYWADISVYPYKLYLQVSPLSWLSYLHTRTSCLVTFNRHRLQCFCMIGLVSHLTKGDWMYLFIYIFTFCHAGWSDIEWVPSLRWWNSQNEEANAGLWQTTEKSHPCWRQGNRCPQQLCLFLQDTFHKFEFNVFCLADSFIRFPAHVSFFTDWLFSCGLDLAFKTPIRPILRREKTLSEINPVTPRNTTSRNIYSPIVRFLTPSKESEYSYCHCIDVFMWGP